MIVPSIADMVSGYTAAEMFADAKVQDNRDYVDVADRWAAKADRYDKQATELVNLALADGAASDRPADAA